MTLATLSKASQWATNHLNKEITPANISYLVQYGRLKKHGENGTPLIDLNDLKNYYATSRGKEARWKKELGDDLNWVLSFDQLREKDTTKHVHRLHPYKGKFIPQLVEYFIDGHTDGFKKSAYFKKGDILLDPFSGSGTALVQASEMGIHAIGVDISRFNCMISEAKLGDYDFVALKQAIDRIRRDIADYESAKTIAAFEKELMQALYQFNNQYFPSPDFKYRLKQGEIDEIRYGQAKEKAFLAFYNRLVARYAITLKQPNAETFLDRWYCQSVRQEIDFAFACIRKVKDTRIKKVLAVILSRTIRSCRATKHYDLATLKAPQLKTYYCWKHKKICKPLYSIKYWLDRYASDTLARLETFARLRTASHAAILCADSRKVDIVSVVEKRNKRLHTLLQRQKIRGIFTSPPYVGQIDYHEQHAYAYDLFGFARKDDLEIGPLYKGQGREARYAYVEGVARVLLNCRRYLQDGFDIFLVANDKYNLYPAIAEKSDMKIVNRFKRPVLNRTERDRNPYAEIIFHLKAE